MHEFIPGQCWINDAELQLGPGHVVAVEQRTVTLSFRTAGDSRTYAKESAPLTRVVFSPGDIIQNDESLKIRVESLREIDGLMVYTGRDEHRNIVEITEDRLGNLINLNRPGDRLFTGQIDKNKWFQLRYQTVLALDHMSHSAIPGLIGCRTELIPHQLYIADEVAGRYAPRVLLADEVGLGKTIEAGLILHQQLLAGRINRVLIIVPENLLHQWLVEMLRRFNLHFSIIDKLRYQAIIDTDADTNPFHHQQLVMCSLDELAREPALFTGATDGDWDMLVVDEAHHLRWSPEHVSQEYRMIELLAGKTQGVLLLTATPEQLGRDGHYARLRLLDPVRFPDFDRFIQEEEAYIPVADAITVLLNTTTPDTATLATISDLLGAEYAALARNPSAPEGSRRKLIEQLLDRHGTGRVLFRNTRETVQGFPPRELFACPLPAPPQYKEMKTDEDTDPQSLLSIELAYQARAGSAQAHWSRIDPRLGWLRDLLVGLKQEKTLVITSATRTAIDIADYLRMKTGIHAAIFHQDMTIIERDRAAAWFADSEAGAQVLICSESGSEGRNFQFSNQLVLFDLPLNPDLLEQRIGRLDRIGQRRTIQIHVPYIEHTAQAVMFHWYHQGLDAFSRPCTAGLDVFNRVQSGLLEALRPGTVRNSNLIEQTRAIHAGLNAALEQGRDRLLEYNSCRPARATALHKQAIAEDENSVLPEYMDRVFDCFGVHSEEHSATSLILSPAENMLTAFPHLPEDGMTISYSRQTALAHEDWQFLTWTHPMVISAMDMILSHESGNTAVISFNHPEFTPGSLLLECHYILDSAADRLSPVSRYLPSTLIRKVIGEHNTDHTGTLDPAVIDKTAALIDRETARKIVSIKQAAIKAMMEYANRIAIEQAANVISVARSQTRSSLSDEIHRLRDLSKVNPNIRQEEIGYFQQQLQTIETLLDSASPRMNAVRVIVAT